MSDEAMCCPLDDDGERAELFFTETRKAAKEHHCCECHAAIAKGESYNYCKGLQDGDWWACRTCAICHEIGEHFACGAGRTLHMLWEQLEENFLPDMRAGGPCLEGLSVKAKEALFERKRIQMGLE